MKRFVFSIIITLLLSTNLFSQTRIDTMVTTSVTSAGFNSSAYGAFSYYKQRTYPAQGVDRLNFRLLKPLNYNPNSSTKYPLFVMYHGRGEAGDPKNGTVINDYHLLHGGKVHLDARNGTVNFVVNGVTKVQPRVDAFVLFPQEPYGSWTNMYTYSNIPVGNPGSQLTTALSMSWDVIDSLLIKHKIDPDRIYVHGLSSGGTAVWTSLYHRPDLFAVAQPMSTPGDTARAKYVANIPIWLHQGSTDNNPLPYYSYLMLDALAKAGAVDTSLVYTEYAGVGHNTWDYAYKQYQFLPFFLKHSKNRIRVLGVSPICPGESVALGFSYNYYYYQWYKDGVAISGANSFRLENVSSGGNYYIKYKRKSNSILETSETLNLVASPGAAKPTITPSGSTLLPSPDASNVILRAPKGFAQYEWSTGSVKDSIIVATNGSYTVRVRQSGQCWSLVSDPILVKTGGNSPGTPAAPTNLSATPRSSTSILVSWFDNSTTETGFEIYRAISSQGPYKFIKLLTANSVSSVDTLLNSNTRYYYKVRAVNDNGGNLSTSFTYANTYKDFIFPTTPTNLKISRIDENNGITLSWTESTDNIGIKEYRLYSNGLLLGTSTTNSIRITPPGGLTYLFQVIAVDGSGNLSVPSAIFPFKYDGFGLVSNYYEIQSLNNLPNFDIVSAKGYGVTSNFNLSGTSGTASITDLVVNPTTNLVKSADNFQLSFRGYVRIASPGTFVFYLKSDDGSKMYFNNQPTAVISNDLVQAPTEKTCTLTVSTAGWYPIRVDFFEKSSGQTLELQWAKTSGNNTFGKQFISNTTNNSTSSNLSYLPSGYVPNVTNATPGQVQGISIVSIPAATNTGNGGTIASLLGVDKPKIQISWNANNTSGVTGYEIYRIRSGSNTTPATNSTSWAKIAQIPYNVSLKFIDSVGLSTIPIAGYLEPGYYYFYKIVPISSSGVGGNNESGVSSSLYLSTSFNNIASITGNASYAPTGLTATGISNSVLRLTWTDNNKANNSPVVGTTSESGTEIYRSSYSNGPFSLVGKALKNATTYSDSTGIVLTTYYYKIRAYNFKGYSDYNTNGVVSATTQNKPNPPINLVAATAGPKNINLSWVITDDIALGLSIFRSTDGVNFTKIDSIPNPTLDFYQDKNLTENTTYYYKIRAYNTFLSDFSSIASAKTDIGFTPSTADWRLPIVAGTFSNNFINNQYGNLGKIQRMKDSLEQKRDFLDFMYLGNTNSTVYFQFQLPAASMFPNGGLITYNVAETQDTGSDTTRMAVGNNGNLLYPNNNIEKGYFTITVYTSTTSDFAVMQTYTVFRSARNNQLQKIDLPAAWANKYVRISLTLTPSASSKTMWLSEVGLYKFLGAGVRHNYFVLTGASVEEQFMPMGLRRFRKMAAKIPALAAQSKNMLIFNLAISGSNSLQLRDSMSTFLSRHPSASYVIVHQGGNNINSAYTNMRPLTFQRLQTNPNASNFIVSIEDIIKTIFANNKVPYISRMHFRDYRSGGNCGPNDIPAVFEGRNQENGSLPINLLIDSLTRKYTPYAFSETEKRSMINFYPVTLNQQDLIQGDGIHPSEGGAVGPSNFDTLTTYWLQYPIRHAYTGGFYDPKIYNPSFKGVNFNTCILPPANKPKLDSLTAAAVKKALFTKSGNDIWEARILVEQMGDKAIRVPYVLQLDSLRDFRSPKNPSDLTVNSIDNTSVILNWLDLSSNETAFLIYRSTDGINYNVVASLSPNTLSYTDNGLSAANEYSYYVRAINGTFKSGITNIVKIRPLVTYYLKSTGNISSLSSWGRSTNGTGTAPSNFTGAGQTFIIANRSGVAELTSNMDISGSYSRLIVLEGQTFKIGTGVVFNGEIEQRNNSNLLLYGSNLPTLAKIDTTSNLYLGNNYTLPNNLDWGNIQLEQNKILTLNNSTTTIKGNLNIKSGSNITGTSPNIKLKGNLVFQDSTVTLSNVGFILNGNTQNLDGKAGTIRMRYLKIKDQDSVIVLNGTKIVVTGSSTDDNCEIASSSKLVLGVGKLYLNGNTSLNKDNQSGIIFTNGGGVYINTTSTDNSNLWFSENGTDNKLNELYVSTASLNDTVILRNPLTMRNNFKLSNGIFKTNNVISFINNEEFKSRILKVGSNTQLLDSIKYENFIGPNKKQGTHFIGSSIKNRPLKEWMNTLQLRFTSAGSDVKIYKEDSTKWSFVKDINTLVVPGKGYTAFLLQSTLDSTRYGGIPFYNYGLPVIGNGTGNNTSNFKIPITKTTTAGGWNLVSNPYPCEIDWTKAIGWNKSAVENTVYLYNGNMRKYAVFDQNTNTKINGADSIIPAGQGFFVRKTSIGSGFLELNEDAKIGSTPDYKFFRVSNTDAVYSKLFISLTDGIEKADETALVFGDDLSEQIDEKDIVKYEGEIMNLYSVVDNIKYGIQALPLMYANPIPLGFNTTIDGDYYLTFTDQELFYKLDALLLYDSFTGTTTNLLRTPFYKFNVNSKNALTVGNNRFKLNYSLKQEIVTDIKDKNEIENIEVYPNPFNKKLNLKLNAQTSGIATLTITDLSGREIHHNNNFKIEKGQSITELSNIVDFENHGKGVYLLKINSATFNFTTKLVYN